MLSIFFFGIEELATQLEEPFTILILKQDNNSATI